MSDTKLVVEATDETGSEVEPAPGRKESDSELSVLYRFRVSDDLAKQESALAGMDVMLCVEDGLLVHELHHRARKIVYHAQLSVDQLRQFGSLESAVDILLVCYKSGQLSAEFKTESDIWSLTFHLDCIECDCDEGIQSLKLEMKRKEASPPASVKKHKEIAATVVTLLSNEVHGIWQKWDKLRFPASMEGMCSLDAETQSKVRVTEIGIYRVNGVIGFQHKGASQCTVGVCVNGSRVQYVNGCTTVECPCTSLVFNAVLPLDAGDCLRIMTHGHLHASYLNNQLVVQRIC